MATAHPVHPRLKPVQIFAVFFKAGCGFGGGLGVLALLEEELVTRRRIMDRNELITLWGIGRIVPCGTMTAVTVAIGYRFGGLIGSVVALIAVILPGFLCTVGLAAAYAVLGHGSALAFVKVTLLPAALALILASAARLGRDIVGRLPELALAVAALFAAVVLHVNPTVLLLAGGGLGALFLAEPKRQRP